MPRMLASHTPTTQHDLAILNDLRRWTQYLSSKINRIQRLFDFCSYFPPNDSSSS
ncbi:hypothetical protein H4Q26_003850 [Puccinia striiformis f. sp. tritici PST-130]|nr:hypothetical protein H4Q26_003850 [Puccinia striiformis f. sp. tritici PST-130]